MSDKSEPEDNLKRGASYRKSKRVGRHRKEDESGAVFYKKAPQDHISGALQLGITHSVGSHTVDRDVLLQDFEVIETIVFPKAGTTLTPHHTFDDFRFKSYAPLAFRYFRDIFNISTEDFLHSIGARSLIPIGNPGASGSCFWITHDDEFIVKTVQQKEASFLTKLLPAYFMAVHQNPKTLLPKFYGLFNINIGGHNIRVCVMNNLLPRRVKMHQKYDLKGSTFKRKASKSEREKKSPTLKDLDFVDFLPDGIKLEFEYYEALKHTIQADTRLLHSFKIMDYSLLLGIHNETVEAESRDKEEKKSIDSEGSTVTLRGSRKPRDRSKHISLNPTTLQNILAKSARPERFQIAADPWGGIPATNSSGDKLKIYLGIIDILQCYKTLKRIEHAWKAIIYDGRTVSVHRPGFYKKRFEGFLFGTVFRNLPMTESLRRLNEKDKQKLKQRAKFPPKTIDEHDAEVAMDGDLGEIQAKLTAELNENINSIDRRKTFKGTKIPIKRDEAAVSPNGSGDAADLDHKDVEIIIAEKITEPVTVAVLHCLPDVSTDSAQVHNPNDQIPVSTH